MNKLYFEGNVLDLYASDYEYLQDSVANEVSKLIKTVATASNSLIEGFDLSISSTNTKLKITHSTPSSTGLFCLESGIIVESSTGIVDNIALSDYTNGIVNYVYLQYEAVPATYYRNDDTMYYNERKAIDFSDYTLKYNRLLDNYSVTVMTAAEYNALTLAEKANCVLIGETTAQGAGVPLTSINLNNVSYFVIAIANHTITVDMLSTTIVIPQRYVDHTSTGSIDDNYVSTPVNLQDDLNKIRTIIKAIKQTPDWDTTFTGVESSDAGINKSLSRGVLPWESEFAYSITAPLVITVSTGKAILGRFLGTQHSNDVSSVTITQGDRRLVSNEAHTTPATGNSFNLDQVPIDPNSLVITEVGVAHTYIEGTDYDITSTGEMYGVASIYVKPGGSMGVDDVLADYDWGYRRIDAIVMTSTGAEVREGLALVIPIPPIIGNEEILLYYVAMPPVKNILLDEYIIDCREYLKPKRLSQEIKATDSANYDSTFSNFYYSNYWGMNKLSFFNQTITTGLGTMLERGNTSPGWDIDDVTYLDVLYDYFMVNGGESFISVNSSTGATYLRTVIYTQEDDELWINVFPKDNNTVLTLKYEYSVGSGVFNVSKSIALPNEFPNSWNSSLDNRRLNPRPVPILLDYGFSEGYHAIEIGIPSGKKLFFSKLFVGRHDFMQEKEALKTSRLYTSSINFVQTSTGTHTGQYDQILITCGCNPFISANNCGNTYVGIDSGYCQYSCTSTGCYNTALGTNALYNNKTCYNTAIGSNSLCLTSTGYSNTAIGAFSLRNNYSGCYNTAVGTNALYNNTASSNTAIGNCSLYCNTMGFENTAVGTSSLSCNTSGSFNTAIGKCALEKSTTGVNNTALGSSALRKTSTGMTNVGVGSFSLLENTCGCNNTATGGWSLSNNTTGCYNTALGTNALYNNTIGCYNTAIGGNSSFSGCDGCYNTVVGSNALYGGCTASRIWKANESERCWVSVDSSCDGCNLIAVTQTQDDYIYTSINGGTTWTTKSAFKCPGNVWGDVASSCNGCNLVVIPSGNIAVLSGCCSWLSTSTDGGNTWTPREVFFNWSTYWYSFGTAVASSDNGCALVSSKAYEYFDGNWYTICYWGNIRTSIDGGVTWGDSISWEASTCFVALASSANGCKLIVASTKRYPYGVCTWDNSFYICTSADRGGSWCQRTAAGCRYWTDVASSSDGCKLAATAQAFYDIYAICGDYIYTSADSGATWCQRTAAGCRLWSSISMSSNGCTLIATAGYHWSGCCCGSVYTSADCGATWTTETDPGIRCWAATAISDDGCAKVAAGLNTKIWTTPLFSQAGHFNTAIGSSALYNNMGDSNVAIGKDSLCNNTSGCSLTAIGLASGWCITTACNINVIGNYLNAANTSNTTWISNITGVTVTGTAVLVSASGQLGVAPSSCRYKEDIKDMSVYVDSSKIYSLCPRSFTWNQNQCQDLGLIAEEVNKVIPQIVYNHLNDKSEEITESIYYDKLTVLLLAEIQKLKERIEVLESKVE